MIMVYNKNENIHTYLSTVLQQREKKSRKCEGVRKILIFMKGVRKMKKYGNYWSRSSSH
jgi:hypothetical protein